MLIKFKVHKNPKMNCYDKRRCKNVSRKKQKGLVIVHKDAESEDIGIIEDKFTKMNEVATEKNWKSFRKTQYREAA